MPPAASARSQGRLPDPPEIVRHLDRFVIGQARAKRDLAVAVYNHYLAAAAGRDFGKQHILLLGPTGSGKTFLVKCLADFLDIPVGFSSATSLVETGYVGDPVDSVVRRVLARCDGDAQRAQTGIVFLDEIDKIRRCPHTVRDVSGEGVQNGLLTLLDGRIVHPRDYEHRSHDPIDTSRMLFICTGAFVELAEIIRRRLGTGQRSAGFRSDPAEEHSGSSSNDFEAFRQAETSDLVQFGFIPELIGRFGTICALHGLSEADLVHILRDGEESAIRQHSGLFALHGIHLEFEEAALNALAAKACSLGTGARALNRLVKRALDPISDCLPTLADDGVTRIVVTPQCIEGSAEPTLIRGKRAHKRRDAALRRRALELASGQPSPSASRTGPGSAIARQGSPAHEKLRNRLQRLARNSSPWQNSLESEPDWWESADSEDSGYRSRFVELAKKLKVSPSKLHAFFLSCQDADADAVRANLSCLDFLRRQEQTRLADEEAISNLARDTLPDLLEHLGSDSSGEGIDSIDEDEIPF